MAFYVDAWPSCKATRAIAISSCKDMHLQETVYVDARNYEKLFLLRQHVPIDWNNFHLRFFMKTSFQFVKMLEICLEQQR